MNNLENGMMIAEIKKMTFCYGNNCILDHMDFSINFGDYIILTGENGCGKSTFLKALLGELKPLQGEVLLFGQPVSSKVFRRFRIGYVSQNSISKNQNFPATVKEIMRTGLYGTERYGQVEEKIFSILEELDMQDYLFRRIGELSGGQQQRVMLARALVSRPQFLILDEPSIGMDSHSLDIFCQILEKQNKKNNVTILLITHEDAEKFCGVNRCVTIKNRRIVE